MNTSDLNLTVSRIRPSNLLGGLSRINSYVRVQTSRVFSHPERLLSVQYVGLLLLDRVGLERAKRTINLRAGNHTKLQLTFVTNLDRNYPNHHRYTPGRTFPQTDPYQGLFIGGIRQ